MRWSTKKTDLKKILFRLSKKNLRLVSEYVNCTSLSKFVCLLDGNEIETPINNALSPYITCSICSQKFKIEQKNKKIDDYIKRFNIKRIGSFVRFDVPIEFICLNASCNFSWKISSMDLWKRKTGCPKCNNSFPKLNNKLADDKLAGRTVKRIGNYIKNSEKIDFQCLNDGCGHIWPALPSNIFAGANCPKCSDKKLTDTNRTFDEKIKNRKIKRLEDYIRSNIPIRFQCLNEKCGHVWKSKPGTRITNKGCPECSKNRRVTNKILDDFLKNLNIERMEDSKGQNKPIWFRCLLPSCRHEWVTKPAEIMNHGTRCPKCLYKNQARIGNFIQQYSKINPQKRLKYGKRIFRIDFFIEPNLIIEYNGAQHYRPIRFGNMSSETMKENFNKQKRRDKALRKFCQKNSYRLLEIPYYLTNYEQEEMILDFLQRFLPAPIKTF